MFAALRAADVEAEFELVKGDVEGNPEPENTGVGEHEGDQAYVACAVIVVRLRVEGDVASQEVWRERVVGQREVMRRGCE